MNKNACMIVALVALTCSQAMAQRNRYYMEEKNNDGGVVLMNFQYGASAPGADLADRFGSTGVAGVGVDFLTKGNWLVGGHANFHFGKNVKTDVLAPLRSQEGFIFADDAGVTDVKLRERALYFGAHVGKIIPISQQNRRSGIRLTLGAGFLQHKIRIQDEPQIYVSLLSDTYKKGYDRLTNGLALTEFIGYHFLAKRRTVNFMAGVELTQGFTQNRRSYNYDTRERETDSRLDLLTTFKIGWTIPMYVGENADEIRY